MLEEKNDNLLDADGNTENNETAISADNNQPLTEEIEQQNPELSASDSSEEQPAPLEEGIETSIASTDSRDSSTEVENTAVESETEEPEPNTVELTEEQLADDSLVVEAPLTDAHQDAMNAISEANAEEGEDDSLSASHEIPMKDYENMSMEDLTTEMESLLKVDKLMSVKGHVDSIRSSFITKYNHFIEDKRKEFVEENPESNEDFHYHLPLKSKFDQLYNQFRDKRNAHYKSLQNNLQANLETRLAIVDELKELINPQENIKDTLKHFNELRERWKNAGPIPKDKYNHVWNNYHFHVENFYDYLHLDREARDIDFRHNLEQKEKIVARVEELVNEPDINKAFRELQDLHRIWKEEIGPVSREHREEIWNRFSALTKRMHDKREQLFEGIRAKENENLAAKKEIIAAIEELAQEKMNAHASWQQQVAKVEDLRNRFFALGKVPSEVNEETWSAFKTAVRNFNALKNSFYKDIKKDQQENLNKKMELVERAVALKDSEDFAASTPIMKQIQEEWKHVGHVPRKYSDKIWKEFREACNHYFERLKAQRSEADAEELQAFEKKKAYLETIKDVELTGEHKADLDMIKGHIETWKSFGRVPFSRKHIDGKFNKVLDVLFEKLSLSKKESEMMRFSNRIDQLSESNDTRKLDNERIFLMRKIEETQGEIFQLENNIQFFTNTKNAKKESAIVIEVRKNIERHREQLEILKDKLKQLKNLNAE